MNKEIVPRENETASILHRNKMDECPANIDRLKWSIFRENYNKASKLQILENPVQIDIELNSNCNLKCKFCIQSVQEIKKVFLNFEDFKKIINQCYILGIKSLKLNYMNEPLLNKDIFKYIKYAKSKDFINIFFSTNGILLNEKNIKNIISSGVTKIFVSLDADTKETYEKLRGYSGFENIKENILNFLKIRKALNLSYPLIRVNFLKTTENIHELQNFISFWENKVDMINIQEMDELIDHKSKLHIDKNLSTYKCAMPFKQLVVNASGDILPCCTMYGIRHKIGNIKDMTLKEAWESNKIKYLRDLHVAGKGKENPICNKCIYG